jgi:hypothetical protein
MGGEPGIFEPIIIVNPDDNMKINIIGDLPNAPQRSITELESGDIFLIPPFNDEVYLKVEVASPGAHITLGLSAYVTLDDGRIVTGKEPFDVILLKPMTVSDNRVNLVPA